MQCSKLLSQQFVQRGSKRTALIISIGIIHPQTFRVISPPSLAMGHPTLPQLLNMPRLQGNALFEFHLSLSLADPLHLPAVGKRLNIIYLFSSNILWEILLRSRLACSHADASTCCSLLMYPSIFTVDPKGGDPKWAAQITMILKCRNKSFFQWSMTFFKDTNDQLSFSRQFHVSHIYF